MAYPHSDASHPALFSFDSHRLKIGLMLMLGLAAIVCMRTNLNMAVVCMVNTTNYRAQLSSAPINESMAGKCRRDDTGSSEKGYNGTLNWTPQMQASLLTASFYSSLVTITFSGSLADRFGPKLMLCGACFVYVFVTMATPILADLSFIAIFSARLIMGLAEGFIMPSIGSMAGRWFPAAERATMAGIYTTGNHIGSASSSIISAALCGSPPGWPSIFYFFGAIGIIWMVAWMAIATNAPINNRFISDREAAFLESNIQRNNKSNTIPWQSILRSKPIYACLCAHFAYNFSSMLIQTFLPTYFRDELMIPLSTNGVYTMIPFLVQIFSGSCSSILADTLKRKGVMKSTQCAKFCQTICAFGTAVALTALAFIPSCNRPWIAAVILTFYGIFYSFGIPGFWTAMQSLAPQHSGTLTSMTMISATLANISSPMLTSLLMTLKSQHIWSVVFTITAALNVIGGVIFLVFGEAEVQQWAKVDEKRPSVVITKEANSS